MYDDISSPAISLYNAMANLRHSWETIEIENAEIAVLTLGNLASAMDWRNDAETFDRFVEEIVAIQCKKTSNAQFSKYLSDLLLHLSLQEKYGHELGLVNFPRALIQTLIEMPTDHERRDESEVAIHTLLALSEKTIISFRWLRSVTETFCSVSESLEVDKAMWLKMGLLALESRFGNAPQGGDEGQQAPASDMQNPRFGAENGTEMAFLAGDYLKGIEDWPESEL